MKASIFMTSTATLVLLLGVACADKPAEGNDDETGTGDETATESDDDDVGESGTSTSSTTNDEAESSSESSSDDESCPIGAEGCPCTDGGGCDPGLTCEGGTCETPAGTDDVTDTTDTSDTDTSETDTDTTETTDTGGDPLYQACPGGEDSECAPDEICVTGSSDGNDWSMCTSGGCNDDDECAVDDNDTCADLPGDGEPVDYCVPQTCGFQDPCPDDMACVMGFGGNAPSVCVWPN